MKFEFQTVYEEEECRERILKEFSKTQPNTVTLNSDVHIKYLLDSLTNPLPSGYVSLDASRPWLFFWSLRALSLLKALPSPDSDLHQRCVSELMALQHPTGGFRGNHGQCAHLAATYAACAALRLLDCSVLIDTTRMLQFLQRLKQPNGRFMIQEEGGEEDLRASYCAVAVAKICGLLPNDTLFDPQFVKHIKECQTFEGGLGAVPFAEAHGGYTFCGVAALALVGQADKLDLNLLTRYIARLQCNETGGLRGRTNKLVDGCYSYWQAAAFLIAIRSGSTASVDLNMPALRRYILCACQDHKRGGLRDKPGKPADLYHTCYCLSGLWLTEHYEDVDFDSILLNVS